MSSMGNAAMLDKEWCRHARPELEKIVDSDRVVQRFTFLETDLDASGRSVCCLRFRLAL